MIVGRKVRGGRVVVGCSSRWSAESPVRLNTGGIGGILGTRGGAKGLESLETLTGSTFLSLVGFSGMAVGGREKGRVVSLRRMSLMLVVEWKYFMDSRVMKRDLVGVGVGDDPEVDVTMFDAAGEWSISSCSLGLKGSGFL